MCHVGRCVGSCLAACIHGCIHSSMRFSRNIHQKVRWKCRCYCTLCSSPDSRLEPLNGKEPAGSCDGDRMLLNWDRIITPKAFGEKCFDGRYGSSLSQTPYLSRENNETTRMSGRTTLLLLTIIFLHLSPLLPTSYYTMSHVAVHATGGAWSDHCDFDLSCWMLCRLVSGSLHS